MKEIISFICSDKKKIYTRLLLAEDNKKLPLVIFSHGLGANYMQEQKMQEMLAEGYVAVLSFDFAGGAGFVESKSEGTNEEMSVFTEMQNLRDVIEYAKSLDVIDEKKIYLVGASQGAIVSMLVAKERSQEISALYLLYPALPLFEDGMQRYAKKEEITQHTNLHGIMVGRKYFWDIHGLDVYELIKDIDMKIHIFHGDKDKLVAMSYVDEAIRVLPNAKKTVVKDGEHGFKKYMQVQIAKKILEDIKEG